MSKYHSIIKAPSITEKNTAMRTAQNKYVFEVDRKADKTVIKSAIEHLFNVKVVSINTLLVKGKYKRMGKSAGYRQDWKKAIVRIEKGQKIDRFGEV